MRTPTKTILAAAIAAAAIASAGCGVSTDGADKQLERQQAAEQQREQAKPTAKKEPLPQRPSGLAVVDGSTRGSLTSLAAQRYRGAGGTTTIEVRNHGEKTAFADFCAGKIDMVDSSRPMSKSEWQACNKRGIKPVQLQVAADAVVLATKAETDIGVDCLTTAQVRDMFRAGSPIYNWSQLGYDSVPLRVTGPDEDNNAFSFFGRYVLGSAEPTMQDLRSDYVEQPTDRETRSYIIGSDRDEQRAQNLQTVRDRVISLRSQRSDARVTLSDAKAETKEAARQVRKGVADNRSVAAQAKDRARLDRAKRRESQARSDYRTVSSQLSAASRQASTDREASQRVSKLRGRIGYFRFSYYELYEDQLRPVEIDLGAGTGRNCIFPSQRTVTSAVYPLARQLLITTSTAQLGRAETRDFLKSYLSDSQDLATAQRLVPLPEATLATQQDWLAGRGTPKVVTYETAKPKPTTTATPAPPA